MGEAVRNALLNKTSSLSGWTRVEYYDKYYDNNTLFEYLIDVLEMHTRYPIWKTNTGEKQKP